MRVRVLVSSGGWQYQAAVTFIQNISLQREVLKEMIRKNLIQKTIT